MYSKFALARCDDGYMEFATKGVAIIFSVIRHSYLYVCAVERYFLKIILAIAETKGRVGSVDSS
jgi:hypothetical protein